MFFTGNLYDPKFDIKVEPFVQSDIKAGLVCVATGDAKGDNAFLTDLIFLLFLLCFILCALCFCSANERGIELDLILPMLDDFEHRKYLGQCFVRGDDDVAAAGDVGIFSSK